MIEVKHLTKQYGGHVAINDLSFTIEKGSIYGFLGPNGAGKSTTMNIITGCLGATEGEVLIDGHSILDEPKAAKKLIGYLPEQPPVYPDMTVLEYLSFVCDAKGVKAGEKRMRIDEAMEKTGIAEVKKRLIKNLSKGFKQRVGIAQALIGDPEIIILDEPTVGLDPTQMIEIRSLIKELGKSHTVILSSHILSEVQAVCDTIMIIANGNLVACDTSDNLTRLLSASSILRIETDAAFEEAENILKGVDSVSDIRLKSSENGVNHIEITPESGADIRKNVFCAFADAKEALLEMHTKRASLEEVFIELTKSEEAPSRAKRHKKRSKGKEENEA
ncbi:MAG: ABC transporter ATP-binding protein [Clostridia bacterium]|nr:ABC transporter ATP-binding protein [Clostridia bacterium]